MLALSGWPCADGSECGAVATEQSTDHQHHNHDHDQDAPPAEHDHDENQCSPLCLCQCCHVDVQVNTRPLELEAPATGHLLAIAYRANIPAEPFNALFRPPRA